MTTELGAPYHEKQMLKLLSPQKAQDDAGFIVQIVDRNHVEYLDDNRRASVEVEFGDTVMIYTHTLTGWLGSDLDMPLTTAESETILARMATGLALMGGTSKIV